MLKADKFLRDAQNADGGWPYLPGGPSAVEPTCFAMLALSSPERGAEFLARDDEPQWTDALALFALSRLNCLPASQEKLVTRLLATEGKRVGPKTENELDGSLRGWPWVTGSFSWVEPTSYALLALKAGGHGLHPRVAEGERLLLDRACVDGGWNYGNRVVMGAKLTAFVPTTAWATLALQGHRDAQPVVERGLDFMEAELARRQSALTLTLAILSFAVFGRATGKCADALTRRQQDDGSWRGEVRLTALAMLALEKKDVFKLTTT